MNKFIKNEIILFLNNKFKIIKNYLENDNLKLLINQFVKLFYNKYLIHFMFFNF